MTRDRRTVASDLLLKAEITPSSFLGLEGEHFLLHQDNVIALVRATLEEAARAQCYWCSKYGAPDLEDKRHRVTYANGEIVHPDCMVPVIHDLIAALDAKADAAPGGGA